MSETKPTNPKDAIGSDKLPMHLWPTTATIYGVLGLLDGALKYGRSNFRAMGVRSSIYYDAARRHLDAWFEGEDLDQDSGLPHLGHALACIAILVESIEKGNLTDDRMYPGGFRSCVTKFTGQVKRLKEKYKGGEVKHYTIADTPKYTVKVESDGFVKGLGGILSNTDLMVPNKDFQPFTVKGLIEAFGLPRVDDIKIGGVVPPIQGVKIDPFSTQVKDVRIGTQDPEFEYTKEEPEFGILAIQSESTGNTLEYFVDCKAKSYTQVGIVFSANRQQMVGELIAQSLGIPYILTTSEALNGLSKMEKKSKT